MTAADVLDLEVKSSDGKQLYRRMLVPLASDDSDNAGEAENIAPWIVHVAGVPTGLAQKCIACGTVLQDGAAKTDASEQAWFPPGRLIAVLDFITKLRPANLPFFDDEQFCRKPD